MAFDAHTNFAFSYIAGTSTQNGSNPGTGGTSFTLPVGDGAKFPVASFNAMVWPNNIQPLSTNCEIVRVTNVATDTFTVTRSVEGSTNQNVLAGYQIAAGITKKTIYDIEGGLNGSFDYIISGCVWTADSPGSTLNASMTSGVIWLGGVQLTVASITAHAFTANDDNYVDFTNNGDGTAVPVYTAVANNAASPALSAGNLRNGIIVAGATSIAAATSINQGQYAAVLPIASGIAYTTTDSLGNLINPRDSNRKVLGYRQIITTAATQNTTSLQVPGLSVPVIIPTGRNVKVSLIGGYIGPGTGSKNVYWELWRGTVGSGTKIGGSQFTQLTANFVTPLVLIAPDSGVSGSQTYNASFFTDAGPVTVTITGSSTQPVGVLVELE
jgi:hypothetical protein